MTEASGETGGGAAEVAGVSDVRLRARAAALRDAAKATAARAKAPRPDPFDVAVAGYNEAFTTMADAGQALFRERERSLDLIELVELLVNSVANTPKSFAADLGEISAQRAQFTATEDAARQEIEAARASAVGAGVGLAAGAAVVSIAPTAAMWVATTFGTASTGTAISALSGAAAQSAALAWLGGGTLAAGGGGTAGGVALLALAGPIGWSVAGASVLVSVALFTRKKVQIRAAKHEELLAVERNTAAVAQMNARVTDLLGRTQVLRERLKKSYSQALGAYGHDFVALSAAHQAQLAALVNNTKASAALLAARVELESPADDEQ